MHFTDSDANSGTRMAHFQTTWDLLRPRLSNPRTRKLPMTSAITDCMNFHNFKKGCFFFFRFESCVVFKCSGLVSLYSNDGCVILKPIFSYIPCNRKKNLETRHEYSMGGSGEKAAQRLLNSCFDMRVCATLWIIYCWKHSYSTEYWCQMQSGGTKKFLSLLRWATCRQFLFFCCCGQRKNFGPDSCSSQCTIQLGCDSMHAKCKTLHSLAFFKPIACAFWQ